ncbi:MAG TPA: CDP-alcohol phosphatidyltransferase family protein [Vicinamibacterales bacterium]|nr:CDP-alcohol phosphatidyltransferase family protein [Vicinamibacterales bacterium]
MFDESFRARFAGWVKPLAPPLARLGVTANHVTVVSFLLTLVAAALIADGRALAGLAIWILSRIGDGLDGVLARDAAQTSAFGGYLDITLDMAGYAAMVVGFAVTHPALWLAWLAVLAGYTVVITTTLALSDAARGSGHQVSLTNRTFQFTPALTEAGETSVMYGLWVVFPEHVPWLVWVWVAALAFTTVQRTVLAWRLLR